MTSTTRTKPGVITIVTIAAVAATVVNVAIYGIGRASGVSYVLNPTTRIGVGDVVALTLISSAIGLAAAAVAVRWDRRAVRALQVLGAALAVVSTWGDFAADASAATTATLVLMHLVVGIAYVGALEVYLRTSSRRAPTAPRVSLGA